MPMQMTEALKKTPLYDQHVSLQGKIVDFSGWALPVYYSSIMEEHKWTRESCGVFDVSHLGEIHVSGPGAFQFLQQRITNDMNKLTEGGILYSLLCDEKGFTLDDILIYFNKKDDYHIIVNASNIDVDREAFEKYAPESVKVVDQSDDVACIAVQGPKSEAILTKLFGWNLSTLAYYHFIMTQFQGKTVWISRSGYTGEDGFEIFSRNENIGFFWEKLIKDGTALGIKPCGLGARNTLRLEAGNPLYGHELDRNTTPLDAGMKWAVSFDKGGFVGRDMLLLQKEKDTFKWQLAGFQMNDRSIPRDGYAVYKEGKKIGHVTSGSYAPTVGAGIGMAYVDRKFSPVGTEIEIEIHGKRSPARIVKRPFVAPKHKNKK